MKIENIVDVEKFPYVCPFFWKIQTRHGDLHIIRGLLSDGSSGPLILDKCPEAWFCHDQGYVFPYINGIFVAKAEWDLLYGKILMRHWQILSGLVRPAGLLLFAGRVWRGYRERERQDPDWWRRSPAEGGRLVPHAKDWNFPSFRTKDAIWQPMEAAATA